MYETLKKDMEAKRESKVIQRKLRRIEIQATSPELLKKQAAKEEEQLRRKTVAELQEEERKAGIAKRQMERQKAKENKMTTSLEAKPKIMEMLKKLYEDPDTGFGSQQELFEQARADSQYGNLVTRAMVTEFFEQRKKKSAPIEDYKGDNSWIANLPREQYQVDVGYINKGLTEELAQGEDGYFIVSIDVISKECRSGKP